MGQKSHVFACTDMFLRILWQIAAGFQGQLPPASQPLQHDFCRTAQGQNMIGFMKHCADQPKRGGGRGRIPPPSPQATTRTQRGFTPPMVCRQRDNTVAGIKAASSSFWEARTLRRSFIRWQRGFQGRPRGAPPSATAPRPRYNKLTYSDLSNGSVTIPSERVFPSEGGHN